MSGDDVLTEAIDTFYAIDEEVLDEAKKGLFGRIASKAKGLAKKAGRFIKRDLKQSFKLSSVKRKGEGCKPGWKMTFGACKKIGTGKQKQPVVGAKGARKAVPPSKPAVPLKPRGKKPPKRPPMPPAKGKPKQGKMPKARRPLATPAKAKAKAKAKR